MFKKSCREKLQEWYSGPVTHLHLRLDREKELNYIGWEEHQLTIGAAVQYLSRLQGRAALVHDSNHATVEIAKRQTAGVNWETDRNPLTPSIEHNNRSIEIRRQYPNNTVISGVEADIIDVSGKINITPEIARKLDLVVASYHHDEGWYPPENEEGVEQIIKGMVAATSDPNVDIIGHPTRLSRNTVGLAKAEMFDVLGRALVKTDKLFEINLSQFSPENKSTLSLLLAVLNRMTKLGVKFSLGSDFHHTSYLGIGDNYFDGIITNQNVQAAFDYNSKTGYHTNLFRSLFNVINVLESVGVTSDMIVNRNDQVFMEWLNSRVV